MAAHVKILDLTGLKLLGGDTCLTSPRHIRPRHVAPHHTSPRDKRDYALENRLLAIKDE